MEGERDSGFLWTAARAPPHDWGGSEEKSRIAKRSKKPALHIGVGLTKSAGMKLSTVDLPALNKKIKRGPFYDAILKMGYTGLEMVDQENIKTAQAAGLKVLNLAAPGIEVGLSRLENHKSLLPRITDVIYLAGENKIPNVIIYSGNRAGMSDAVGQENCRAGIDELMQEALDNKVRLLFEMLNTFDYPDYMADRATFGLNLVNAIASPGLRLLYDIYHMHRMRDEYMDDLTDDIASIAHIHAAEAPDRSVPEPHGEIPYADIVPKTIEAGYQGYWGMVFKFGRDPLAELKAAAENMEQLPVN